MTVLLRESQAVPKTSTQQLVFATVQRQAGCAGWLPSHYQVQCDFRTKTKRMLYVGVFKAGSQQNHFCACLLVLTGTSERNRLRRQQTSWQRLRVTPQRRQAKVQTGPRKLREMPPRARTHSHRPCRPAGGM